MKAYVCDICGITIDEPHSAKMREFCFTVSNCDICQLPQKNKTKVKIHLCNNCFEGFKGIAKQKMKGGEE
jgi:ribosomal protein L37AE/L43A